MLSRDSWFAEGFVMRLPIAAAALCALAAPLPAWAQETPGEQPTREIERTLGDPATQAAMAEGMAAAAEALLDVPLAPLARAVARAAGEDPATVDPDMTLRNVSPEAEDVPGKVRERLPQMMGAVAETAGGLGAMVPALREAAERMRAAIARAGLPD
ncbi:MAG: hypothetical protein ACEQR8_06270 [Cypionkella sp.]